MFSIKFSIGGEYEIYTIHTALYFMVEIRAIDEIDMGDYVYNPEKACYERNITALDNYRAEIRIKKGSYGLHYIEVDILSEGEVINSLVGSVVFE